MERYPIPSLMFPPIEYPKFQQALEIARKEDEILGQVDCSGPDKVQWQQALEKTMKALDK
jgi:hypothetical protein